MNLILICLFYKKKYDSSSQTHLRKILHNTETSHPTFIMFTSTYSHLKETNANQVYKT